MGIKSELARFDGQGDDWSGYIRDRVVVAGFVFGRAEVASVLCRRVPLYQAEVLHDRGAGCHPGGPGLAVEQLASDRVEEALGHGVVPALALAAVREADLTRIVCLTQGFDFFGWNIRRYRNGKLLIKPSQAAVRAAPATIPYLIDNSPQSEPSAGVARH